MWEELTAICAIIAASELAGRLCSESGMVKFVRALGVMVLIISFLGSVFSLKLDFSGLSRQEGQAGGELSSYVVEQTEQAARDEAVRYLKGLLAAAGLEAEKIEVLTDISEENCIVLTRVQMSFAFDSDAERAKALLKNTLGEEIEVEVKADGR